MYSEYCPIIKMNNIFSLFYTFYEYVLYTAHYFWLSEKHRKVFNKLYPFLLLYMKSGDNISNQSTQSFFCMVSFFITQQYLHMLIYLPARVYNQVYKGKYHFDGVSFETPHWHLSNTGDRSANHESFPQSFKYTARIKSTAPWGARCHRN